MSSGRVVGLQILNIPAEMGLNGVCGVYNFNSSVNITKTTGLIG